MNGKIYFEIQADDPARAANFYRAVFGWEFIKEENLPVEYLRIRGNGFGGAILKRPTDAPPIGAGTNAFVCSFEVPNFDWVAKIISENGGIVALPKFAVPGVCWQGYFLDPENNTFGLFQPDKNARE